MTKREMMKKAHQITARIQKACREMGVESSYQVTFSAAIKAVWAEAKGGPAAPRSAMAVRDAIMATMTNEQKDAYIEAAAARREARLAA